MLLTRLYLRNFRVYEDELDLALPPGLVGIYGPNGAGKSTLLEAVIFTLWGKARTARGDIRSSGVGGDCITEVEFEHEGHLYVVRRRLRGINAVTDVEVLCDGALMSTGAREAERYVQSILGMDDGSFRASVFAEQKQLAAFSDQSPAERRRLVLQLLGVTPLDAARDAARKDARHTAADHDRLRGLLPDLATLEVEAADAEAAAGAAQATADEDQTASDAAAEREVGRRAEVDGLERRRQDHEALVIEGRAARERLDTAAASVDDLAAQLDGLAGEAAELILLDASAEGLPEAEAELRALGAAADAALAAGRVVVPDEPPAPDPAALAAARTAAADAAERVAALDALTRVAAAEAERTAALAARTATLTGGEDCPVCGQDLGDAFERVQAHRQEEARAAAAVAADRTAELAAARDQARTAVVERERLISVTDERQAGRHRWEQAVARRDEAEAVLRQAWEALVAAASGRVRGGRTGVLADAPTLAAEVTALRESVDRQREALGRAERLRGRLERRPALEAALGESRGRRDAAQTAVEALRARVRELGFDPRALESAQAAQRQAAESARTATQAARAAAVAAGRAREKAESAARRLEDGRAQHAKLGDLESAVRHLGRVADLLSEFRNTVVASLGPQLAVRTSELFGELTDHEYEALGVDPETYQLTITDQGREYGLDRFSGSEIDLANLALRVAISEHIHFQSGGTVGLLVLDEVFGPLDTDRKERMLLALTRLQARFRQVLVVTHDSEIKEQLPNAIEVVKQPGRRATARVVAA